MIRKNDKMPVNRRRHSNIVNAATLKSLLKKSETAVYIKEKLNSYFKEPSEFEKKQLLKRRETESFK